MKRLKAGLFTFFYKKADEIVYISKMIQLSTDQLLKLYRFPVFQRVVYNPHGLSRIKELATLEPERFSFKKGKRYIVSVCRLANFKGVHYIIQALYEVKKVRTDVELLIIGEGEEMTALRELVRRLDIESSVHFLGYCSNPFTYISRSDLYIMASETEGLPNVIIEALACGTPVVSSDCISGPREILSPGSDFTRILSNAIEYAAYGVLYPVGNTGLLAEAMLRLLSDETLRNYYTQKGLIRAEDYAEELIANQYLSHFNIT
jgi:N-acetylgalactosamine-N,N'-diacetylbacillosaminyl-diphospho-undecaprenol 4-alpha-N-acetylgalactosaminyltransferase